MRPTFNEIRIMEVLETISDSLRIANKLTIIKELHSIGKIDDDEYEKLLNEAFKVCH